MEGVNVITRTICEQCGITDERVGAEGDVPPISWAEAELTYREEGSGWTNNRRITKILCPSCALKIEKFLTRKSVK